MAQDDLTGCAMVPGTKARLSALARQESGATKRAMRPLSVGDASFSAYPSSPTIAPPTWPAVRVTCPTETEPPTILIAPPEPAPPP